MRNIFLFIRRFFNLLLFFVLQGTAIYILATYNKTHQAFFASAANEVTGSISSKYNAVDYYFRLKQTNDQLAAENARLHNELSTSFQNPDTAHVLKIDSLLTDTLHRIRKFNFLEAKVVNNSISDENNYMTVHRGALQGVKNGMSVIGPDGIVGRVIQVSDNYSRVMSLLNHKSQVSAMLKRGFYQGIINWDGKDPQYIQLRGIPKSAQVRKGDSVLTSNLSGIFPPELMVGTIAGIDSDPSTSFYILNIKTATNFSTVQYVYLTENLLGEEQEKLEAKTPKD
ncbi:MAG TPA: rod shape-determining protein MreC [Panacibacter sp.]|nr:rod shape-determining protein MreC [Panacibacter sp.]